MSSGKIKNFKDENLVQCKYFAIPSGKVMDKVFQPQDLDRAAKNSVKNLRNRFVYAVNNASVRFSKIIAQECEAFIRESILTGRFDSSVAELSESWLRTKERLGKSTHVGSFTMDMVSAISHFRTNIRKSGEKDHTGYVVGIKKSEESKATYGAGKTYRVKDAITPAQKLSILEFGRKAYSHPNIFGTGKTARIKAQPERPIVKIAINAYLKSIGINVPFGGTGPKKMPKSSKSFEDFKKILLEEVKKQK